MWVKDHVWCEERSKMEKTSCVCIVDHVALRHPRTGSVMIEAMSEVFKQYGNKWHIADFFTRVSKFQGNRCSFHADGNALDESIFRQRLTLAMEIWEILKSCLEWWADHKFWWLWHSDNMVEPADEGNWSWHFLVIGNLSALDRRWASKFLPDLASRERRTLGL